MEEYTVNFLADVDVTIEAASPEEARRKAEKMFGEYYDKQFGKKKTDGSTEIWNHAGK